MEEQKKLEEELLDDNSEMSGTEDRPQLLDVSMEDEENGAISDRRQLHTPPSNSNTPATSKGGPKVPSPVPAPMCAPSMATSTGGPPKVIRQITLVGGPSDNTQYATSTGGQVSASVEKPARPQQAPLAPAPGGVYAAIAKYRKAMRTAPFLLYLVGSECPVTTAHCSHLVTTDPEPASLTSGSETNRI